MIEALIFDLDDTLYRERDFVLSGYRAVARHVALRGSWSEDTVFAEMAFTFEAAGREEVFGRLMERFPGSAASVLELVDVYRKHSPEIHLPQGYDELLKRLSGDFKLGIITDGHPEVQRRKVQALALGDTVRHILYTWDHGRSKEKPHPLGFSLMLGSLKADPSNALFIGDNPVKDGVGAHGAGMRFIQVAGGEKKTDRQTDSFSRSASDFFIANLFELPGLLQRMS